MEVEPSKFPKTQSGGDHSDRIKAEILNRADRLFSKIVDFAAPEVIVNYKCIVIEDIEDHDFRATLRIAMEKAGVDQDSLNKLFEIGDAAAAQRSFGRT